MTAKSFIDTNLLVYAHDKSNPQKRLRARKVLFDLESKGLGVVSTHVLQEFYVVVTRKLGVDPYIAKKLVKNFSNFQVVQVDVDLIHEAIDCSILSQINFWDALIVTAALKAQCDVLLTEDLNHGQVFRTLTVENIF